MVVGSYFVKDGDGFIRINVGCPRETLNEALNRIKNVYKYVLLNHKKSIYGLYKNTLFSYQILLEFCIPVIFFD